MRMRLFGDPGRLAPIERYRRRNVGAFARNLLSESTMGHDMKQGAHYQAVGESEIAEIAIFTLKIVPFHVLASKTCLRTLAGTQHECDI